MDDIRCPDIRQATERAKAHVMEHGVTLCVAVDPYTDQAAERVRVVEWGTQTDFVTKIRVRPIRDPEYPRPTAPAPVIDVELDPVGSSPCSRCGREVNYEAPPDRLDRVCCDDGYHVNPTCRACCGCSLADLDTDQDQQAAAERAVEETRRYLEEIARTTGRRATFGKIRPETRAALVQAHNGAHALLAQLARLGKE